MDNRKPRQYNLRSSDGKSKIINHYSSNSLLKPVLSRLRKPSCNDVLNNHPIQHSKMVLEQRQRLSSYQAFLRKLKRQNITKLPSSFSLISIEESKGTNLQQDYDNINFSILKYSNSKLVSISCQIIGKFGLSDICGHYALKKIITEISNGYNAMAYHNFSHAFSLMHMFYHLTKFDRKFKLLFTKEEIGFTLIAALAHDLNHKGTNNLYQIKMDSQLSKIADKVSVLQKMHIRTFFQILKNKNITLIDNTKNPSKVKQLITRAILATDVGKHFKGLEKLKSMRQNNQFDYKNTDHRYFVLEQAFHACDIGNPCLEFKQYMNWAALLSYQFHNQTILQQKNQLQVTQMLRYKGIKQFYQNQIGFINSFAYPLWKELSLYWTGFASLVKNMQDNVQELKKLVNTSCQE